MSSFDELLFDLLSVPFVAHEVVNVLVQRLVALIVPLEIGSVLNVLGLVGTEVSDLDLSTSQLSERLFLLDLL